MNRIAFVLLFLALWQPLFGVENPAPVNLTALLNECSDRQRILNKQYYNYTWISKTTFRKFDKKGVLRETDVRVAENYQGYSRNFTKMLSRNGKELSLKSTAAEEKRLIANLTKDETANQAHRAADQPGPEYGFGLNAGSVHEIHFSSFAFIRNCTFSNPQPERFQGREVLVVSFQPRADFQPKHPRDNPYTKLAGKLWIDLADKIVFRIEAWPLTGAGSRAEGNEPQPLVFYEAMRLPDGMWGTERLWVLAGRYPVLFNGNESDWLVENSEYRKFSVSATEAESSRPNP
ncbi:MAG: hypothetical protein K1Y36_10750 [Blastocatellia bacterium]|nr:hypothetical protein [Blastocatellia bacterium]